MKNTNISNADSLSHDYIVNNPLFHTVSSLKGQYVFLQCLKCSPPKFAQFLSPQTLVSNSNYMQKVTGFGIELLIHNHNAEYYKKIPVIVFCISFTVVEVL